MRKFIVVACAAAAMFTATLFASGQADAMAIGAPAGLQGAADAAGAATQAEQVRYVCRWNGFRQVCWWRPGGYYRPYGFYRPGFYRGPRWGGYRRWGYRRW